MKSKLLLALLAFTLTGVANAQVKPDEANAAQSKVAPKGKQRFIANGQVR